MNTLKHLVILVDTNHLVSLVNTLKHLVILVGREETIMGIYPTQTRMVTLIVMVIITSDFILLLLLVAIRQTIKLFESE
ncbi:hypothetical protein GCM10028820_34510 [Tessaracoccus terricola]